MKKLALSVLFTEELITTPLAETSFDSHLKKLQLHSIGLVQFFRNGVLLVMLLFLLGSCTHSDPFTAFQNAFTPEKLGSGSLSRDSMQWNNAYAAETQELFYTKSKTTGPVIKAFSLLKGQFTEEREIPLPNKGFHSDVYVDATGSYILFSSTMPENEQDTSFDWNVWKASREANTWQSPELYFPNHLEGNQFYPWLTESKNLYCSITPAGSQNSDIYLVEWKDGQYTSPKRLPETINTEALEGDAFVAPDESYLIFAGFERAQNAGKSDLYISFKKENGGWTEAQWLGEDINSEGYDGSPCVTIDGKYLIFTSSRGSIEENTFFNHYIVRFQLERYQRQAFS